MSIHINKPYKIIAFKQKRYQTHYNIPAADCLVVPVKVLDEEALCDIRWEDGDGKSFHLENKVFIIENLVPLNALLDPKLHDVWQQYYGEKQIHL